MVKSNAKEDIYSADFQKVVWFPKVGSRLWCCSALRVAGVVAMQLAFKSFEIVFPRFVRVLFNKGAQNDFYGPLQSTLLCCLCLWVYCCLLCPYLKRSCCKSFKNNMYLCHARRTSSLLLVCTTVLALACLFVEMQKVSGDCAQTRK